MSTPCVDLNNHAIELPTTESKLVTTMSRIQLVSLCLEY